MVNLRKYLFLVILIIVGLSFLLPPLNYVVLFVYILKPNTFLDLFTKITHFRSNNILALFIFLIFVCFINLISNLLLTEYNQQEIVRSLRHNWSYSQIISILFISPIIEELYFRGMLQYQLKFHFGKFWSVIITSCYFSFIHTNIIASPTLFALSLLLGFVAISTECLSFCILFHFGFNVIMLFFIL